MKKHQAMHGQLGYALVEALVSLLIVATGILGVAKLQAVVVGSSAEAKARAEAMTLAQAKLDELRNVVLQSQHHQWVGGACQSGTLVQTGSDTVSGVNASFTRTWTITPTCAPARHQIVVSAGWTGADNSARQVQLHSVIAWNDPARSTAKLAAGSAGGGGMAPQGNAWLGDDVKDYDTLPQGAVSNGADGTYVYNQQAGRWELLVAAAGGGYRVALYSAVPIVSLNGIVALDTASGTATDVLISNVVVYRTDITYCLFPLKFTNQDDPKTYGSDGAGGTGQTSASADKAGAYRCYVPQGWYGDIGLFQRSYNCANKYNLFDGETSVSGCDFRAALACPGIVDGSATLTGIRTHKVLIVNANNQIVGQSGVMPGHEYMLSPDSSTRTRLSRLDFVIFKPKSSGNPKIETCAARIPDTSTTISGTISTGAAYSIQLRNGAGTTTTGTDGVPSIRYPHYIVDRYLSGGGGFVKLSGAVSGACTTLQATGSSGWGNFICPVSGGQYSCEVSYGWSGTVGGQSFSNVIANTTQNVSCPP